MGKPTMDIIEDMSKGPMAPEIIPGGEWFNSEPLTLASLRGKVVLVDFWTYSCINCQRTFPYLRNWWETYKDQDFVIIGVHSPEFEFEKDADNVAEAITDFDLTYPIVQDNNFETWRAYRNRYWPAKYLVDKNGIIRYTHYGEGDYKETEDKIRELLQEEAQVVLPEYSQQEEYTIESRTPEIYLGYGRMQFLSSPENVVEDQPSSYTAPDTIPYNRFAFDGTWTVTEEYSQPAPGSKLLLHYEARNVFLVLNPVNDPGQVDVYLDGEFKQTISVDSHTLYNLISMPEPGEHLLEIRFPQGGVRAFAFTFG
jgi:thiol-disulfide isomerase/thioredoxin